MARSRRQALRLEPQLFDCKLADELNASKTTARDLAALTALPPLPPRTELHTPAPASAAAPSNPIGGAQSHQSASDSAIQQFLISVTSSARTPRPASPLRLQAENSSQCSGNAGKCTS